MCWLLVAFEEQLRDESEPPPEPASLPAALSLLSAPPREKPVPGRIVFDWAYDGTSHRYWHVPLPRVRFTPRVEEAP